MSLRRARRGLSFPIVAAMSVASAQVGTVLSEQEINELEGGLGSVLDPQDLFGWSLARIGDLNGDGIGELAVGAIGDDDGGSAKGAVYVLFLRADGTVGARRKISATSGGFEGNLQFGAAFGLAVAALGDLNGDAMVDLAVGADAGDFEGAIWILFLNPDGTVADEQKIAEGVGGFGGLLEPDDRLGRSLAALGDLDGDGLVELAVGAPTDDEPSRDQGSVWILSLRPDGTVASERKISASEGGFTGTLERGVEFGGALAALGDLDRDGVPDLAVGSHNDSDGATGQGAVWILFLNPDGTVRAHQKISDTEGGFSGESGPAFGRGLASLDDLDGDGVRELAVGATSDEEVWILFLSADGTVAYARGISETMGGFSGEVTDQSFGRSLAWLGDVDGDGFGDLAAGVSRNDEGGVDQGGAWILFLDGHVVLDFESEDDFATPLRNGQDVSTPPELGRLVALSSAGPNAGAATFDSTPGGPNDPSQDRDLLVGSGNVLILQTTDNATQTVPGIFDRPNDEADGGVLEFSFHAPVEPASVALIDIDSSTSEASALVLTDALGRTRAYAIPPGWTGDRLAGGVGRLTLDLTTLAPQPGFASTATAVEDAGYGVERVVRVELHLGGSGALDDLAWRPRSAAVRTRPGPRGAARDEPTSQREIRRP